MQLQQDGAGEAMAQAAQQTSTGDAIVFLSSTLSACQHPAMRKPREDVLEDGHGAEQRTHQPVDIIRERSTQAQGSLSMALEARGRSRRSVDAKKAGVFQFTGNLRLVPNGNCDRGSDGGAMMASGQQMKTPKHGAGRTDVLPQILRNDFRPDGPQHAGRRSPQADPIGNVPDQIYPPTRHIFRVSGYSGGVSAAIAQPSTHTSTSTGVSIGAIKPVLTRAGRSLMQRTTATARQHATQDPVKSLSAVGIDAPQGIKAALDSCRVPLDFSTIKADEEGLRIISRSARGLHALRESTDQELWRPGNARPSISSDNELFVCNCQKVDDTDLVFMSQFESGNLMSAQRVSPQEYDLQLQVDHATTGHTQWFFFCVSNTFPGVQYRFNIINFAKPDSLYTRGQQPLFFSLLASKREKVDWQRVGRDIRYFRNGRKRNGKALFTLSFVVEFAYAKDKCLFAHCYPYTYTELQDYIRRMLNNPLGKLCMTSSPLCTTLGGNECTLLTITSPQGSDHEKGERKVIFLSSRVHPGESNSSWIMKGLLDFLLGPSAEAELLRLRYLFKIVPMLNPDGVINGHYRCNLAGYDLNRHWHDPIQNVHPTIFHAKGMLKSLQQEREVIMFCDIHGHSVKHNLFLYGCPKVKEDGNVVTNVHDTPAHAESDELADFPNVLDLVCPFFSMPDSRFVVEKVKECTGRVVAWRELGISNSFTLEASLCGSGEGRSQQRAQFTCADFEAMGRGFGLSLALASSDMLLASAKADPSILADLLRPVPPETSAHASEVGGYVEEEECDEATRKCNLPGQIPEQHTSNLPNSNNNNGIPVQHTWTHVPVASGQDGGCSETTEAAERRILPSCGKQPGKPMNQQPAKTPSEPMPWIDKGLSAEMVSGRERDDGAPKHSAVISAACDPALVPTATSIVPTYRYKNPHSTSILHPHSTLRSEHASTRAAPVTRREKVPCERDGMHVLHASGAAEAEGESSSDDERNEEEPNYSQDAASSGFITNGPDLGNFLYDCKEIKRKVIYWGLLQQKKRESLEARMHDVRQMSLAQKPSRLDLANLVSNFNSGANTSRPESLACNDLMPTHLQMHLSPRKRCGQMQMDYVHGAGGNQTSRDKSNDRGANWGGQDSGERESGADTERRTRGPHAHPNPHPHSHPKEAVGVRFSSKADVAQSNKHLHSSNGNGGSSAGNQQVSAEFSPLARRQRCTTQRLREKTAGEKAFGHAPAARDGGALGFGLGLGAHKPVGPQCKFLPIMLGSLRVADSPDV